jgi:hypothetical protein
MAQDQTGCRVKETQKERVLRMLTEAGPEGVTSNQFYGACLPRFGARIHELKQEQGLEIRKEPVEQGHFRYILVSRPSMTQQSPADLGRAGYPSPNLGLVDPQGPGDPDSSSPPGQLFEVEPDGPVPHYEWEAA